MYTTRPLICHNINLSKYQFENSLVLCSMKKKKTNS